MEGMIPVLVTTNSDRRGVFAGYVPADFDFEAAIASGTIALTKMRNCIYWSRSVGGVFGLAQIGPDENCKIGALVEQTSYLNGVTFISELTPVAAKAWEDAPCVK